MPTAPRKPLAALLSLSILLALAQIALGGIVRVTGSGDACPDWPTCFGELIPPLDALPADVKLWQVLLEWGHRTNGVVLGIIAILSTLYALIGYRKNRLTLVSALSGLILVTIVGILGGAVVLNDLHPVLRTMHLLLAQLVVLFFVLALLAELNVGITERSKFIQYAATASLVLIFVNLAFGSFVVWQGAGNVCKSWPVCNFSEGLLPDSELEWINIIHRLVTLLTTVLVFYFMYAIRRRTTGAFKFIALLVVVATLIEIAVGGAIATTDTESLFWLYNVWRAIHIGLASVIWVAACFIAIGALAGRKSF